MILSKGILLYYSCVVRMNNPFPSREEGETYLCFSLHSQSGLNYQYEILKDIKCEYCTEFSEISKVFEKGLNYLYDNHLYLTHGEENLQYIKLFYNDKEKITILERGEETDIKSTIIDRKYVDKKIIGKVFVSMSLLDSHIGHLSNSLHNLTKITMHSNLIDKQPTEKALKVFFHSLMHNKTVVEIYLRGFVFQDPSLGNYIYSTTTLKVLDLSRCRVVSRHIFDALQYNKSIEKLVLNDCYCQDILLDKIAKNNSITSLDLSNRIFKEDTIYSLVKSFENNTALKDLKMSNCRMGPGALKILSKLNVLKLDVSHNYIEIVPPCNFMWLNLNDNPVNQYEIFDICPNLQICKFSFLTITNEGKMLQFLNDRKREFQNSLERIGVTKNYFYDRNVLRLIYDFMDLNIFE